METEKLTDEERVVAAEARAEALQARVAELEGKLEAAERRELSWLRLSHTSGSAESELADLRGRVERALEWTDDSENMTCEALAYHVAEELRGR